MKVVVVLHSEAPTSRGHIGYTPMSGYWTICVEKKNSGLSVDMPLFIKKNISIPARLMCHVFFNSN